MPACEGWPAASSAALRASSATASAVSGPGPQRAGESGDDVLAVHVPVQQQDLDQRPGPGGVAVGLAGGGPPGVVDGSELPRGAGLLQRGRAGQRAGLADQRLEVVVQIQAGAGPAGQPLVPGDLGAPVVDDQVRGVQQDPDPAADQPGRHRVAVVADHDRAEPVDSRGKPQACLERLLWQRPQQWPLDRQELPDGPCPAPDPPGLVRRPTRYFFSMARPDIPARASRRIAA
jgi:hypothetical protein